MRTTSGQATLVAVVFVLLVGVITVTALNVYKVDEFLKVWAVIGTLVGVVTGAIPSFFFSRAAAAAQETAQTLTTRAEATQAQAQTLLALSDSDLLDRALAARPDLFGPPPQQPPANGGA